MRERKRVPTGQPLPLDGLTLGGNRNVTSVSDALRMLLNQEYLLNTYSHYEGRRGNEKERIEASGLDG